MAIHLDPKSNPSGLPGALTPLFLIPALAALALFGAVQAYAGICDGDIEKKDGGSGDDSFDSFREEMHRMMEKDPAMKRAFRSMADGHIVYHQGKVKITDRGKWVDPATLVPKGLNFEHPEDMMGFFKSFRSMKNKNWKATTENTYTVSGLRDFDEIQIRVKKNADKAFDIEPAIYLGPGTVDRFVVFVKHDSPEAAEAFSRRIDSATALIQLHWDDTFRSFHKTEGTTTRLFLSDFFVNEDNARLVETLFGKDPTISDAGRDGDDDDDEGGGGMLPEPRRGPPANAVKVNR